MTAVDHAELKRLAEGATKGPWSSFEVVKAMRGAGHTEFVGWEILGRDDERVHSETDGVTAEGDIAFIAAANPEVVLALLSEIEGLKAERDSNWDEYIAERKSRMEHGAREAGHLDAIARLESRANQAERQLSALRTQDSWRPTRGEVINSICNSSPFGPEYKHQDLLLMADAILALRPQTAESGK